MVSDIWWWLTPAQIQKHPFPPGMSILLLFIHEYIYSHSILKCILSWTKIRINVDKEFTDIYISIIIITQERMSFNHKINYCFNTYVWHNKRNIVLKTWDLSTNRKVTLCIPFTFYRKHVQPDYELLTFKRRIKSVCHLQALLGAHHILHIFRIRVKLRLFSKSQEI